MFKIQVLGCVGWGDLKSSVDGGPYVVDLYPTAEEALAEVDEMPGGRDEHRVVPEDTPEEEDVYLEEEEP